MRVIIEADGGSRGNPGPAAFGALIRDADTGEIIAERAEAIGVATNNVAEYKGLIAGLELFAEHTPEAELEVRMDSKLVVEQMAGRWKVKHPDMRPLAIKAQSIAPFGVTWTWVPREQNKAADAILNRALDVAQGKTPKPTASQPAATKTPMVGWGSREGDPTTIILLRHGVTDSTVRKLFSGTGGSDQGLNEEGDRQAAKAADWLGKWVTIDAIVSSPLRRARETAGFVSRQLGLDVDLEPGLSEASFGEWDGRSFADVMREHPDELKAWLTSTSIAPPGGETFDSVFERVVNVRDGLVSAHPGKTIVAVSHVTPIKMLVRLALGAPMPVIHRMELAPASITTIAWWPEGMPSLRNFSVVPESSAVSESSTVRD